MNDLTTSQLIHQNIEAGDDFEWYPTTNDMITAIEKHLESVVDKKDFSVLDCGAGDGRVLNALAKGNKYAIEKSKTLLNALDKSIYVVGTDFQHQTLIDKKVDIVFSNPPYSEYVEWAEKIIREANASYIYLIIPERWINVDRLQDAIKLRKAEFEIIGVFDFLNAERKARAKVNIVGIEISEESYRERSIHVDPFSIWFNQYFEFKTNENTENLEEMNKAKIKDTLKNEMVQGGDLIKVLENLYLNELDKLMKIYQKVTEIDPVIMKEFDISIEAIESGLEQKITGLKDVYWQELFENLDKITRRLSHGSRGSMLNKLMSQTHVDFTAGNAYAILGWVIKNANGYFDQQLINLVEDMTEKANVLVYVSNQRTFKEDGWNYLKTSGISHYGLDFRIVLERCGGLSNSTWSYERDRFNGLSERAHHLINDVLTIADNLGFSTKDTPQAAGYAWESRKKVEFYYRDHRTNKDNVLMTVRAFLNGNLHIKFNQRFICQLNVEFGRLKGWLKCKEEAEKEMGLDAESSEKHFNSNLHLSSDKAALLLGFNEDVE